MPVPQTLAKKLNKDVFRGKRERQGAYWAAVGTHLRHSPGQRGGKDRRLRGGGRRRRNPPSSLTNPNQGLQLLLWGREQGGGGGGEKWIQADWASPSSVSMNGCSLIAAQSLDSLIRVVFTCCEERKIKLSHNDFRVHISLLLYTQSFARLDTFCVHFFPLNEAICF